MTESHNRSYDEVTTPKFTEHELPLSKAEKYIELKIQNPNLNHKQVALDVYPRVHREKIHYDYARRVWGKYLKNLVTNKGSPFTPFPFMVQNFGRYCLGLASWYLKCPVTPSSNRNLQKVYKTNYFSVILHKNGSVFIYDYHKDWAKHLRRWLETWMHDEDVALFFDHLVEEPRKHVGVNAPGIPTGIKFTIAGLGTFSADKTPYKKGTLEYEFNPGFEKRLNNIEGFMEKRLELDERLNKNLEIFAVGMEQHMKLIGALQDVAIALTKAVEKLGD